jgi:hypothetical protein
MFPTSPVYTRVIPTDGGEFSDADLEKFIESFPIETI